MAKYKHNPSLLMAVPELGTVKDLVTNNNFTITGGVGAGFTEPSNFRTLLGAQAPVFASATTNVHPANDTLTQPSIGAWGSLSNCTLETSTDEPWEGYSHSGKMTVTANGDATTSLDITAVSTNAAWTESLQVKGVSGKTYSIILTGDVSGATTLATPLSATGDWQPIQLSKTFAADTTRTLTLKAISASANDIIYWSALQLESGAVATPFCLGARTTSSASIANPLTAGQAFTAMFIIDKTALMTTETIVDCTTAGNGWKLRGIDGRLSFEVSDGVAGKQQYLTLPTTQEFLAFVTRAEDGIMDVKLAGIAATSQANHAQGSGDDQFNNPSGVCSDGTHIYVADRYNHRIVKRLASDLSFVAKIGTQGSGDDQFNLPTGVATDGTYVYVADYYNHRIVKRLASDLSYVSKIGTQGSGDDQFNLPTGVCSDGTHIYVVDHYNHRIVKRLASDLSYVSKIGTQGSGNDQFNRPYGVATDGTYVYVADQYNHRIVKRLASDLSYVSKIGTQGSGDDQFNLPIGVATDGTYVYVADQYNHRIVKRTPALAFDQFSPLGNGLETALGAFGFGQINGSILCAIIGRVLEPSEIAEIEAKFAAGTLEWGELATLEAPLVAPEPIELKSAYSVKAEIGDTLRFVTMNHSLSGGTDYGVLLDLNDDGVYCASRIEYPPPAPRIEYRDPAHIDGREVSFHKYENRELTLTLNIFGADKEDLSNNVHELWQLLTGDNPILEWKPEGWTKGLYFDLIAPPLQFNVSDWFEAPTHRWHKDVMSNVEIVIEAKPFARGAEETVTLLDGNGSPSIPACTGIVVPPEAFKGDHPAPADIFIDRVGGELWTDLIFGQRIEYSEDFDPIQNMSVGDSQVTPAVGRLEDDYWVLDTGTNLVTNGGFEDGSTGWTFYSPLSVRVISTPAYVFEGTKALKLYGSHHYTDAAIATSARIPIDPTKPYILTLRYMGDADAMFTVAALSGTTLPSATQIYYNAFGGLPSQYAKLTKYFPVGSFAPTDDSLWIRLYHDNRTDNVNSSSYVDNVEVLEAGPGVFIQAEYGVASHAGRYLPTASVSFAAPEEYDAVTINYIVADKAGVPITEQVQGATVDSGNPNTNFHDVAFLPSRFSAITIPSHRVSDFADKTEFLQQLRLETDSRTTADFWYDYVGIVPIDRGYTEVRNWDGNEHLILDSRSSRMPLTSRSGTYDDAMVYDLEKTKGECSFVADPQGFNGAILAVTNKDGDHQILSYVNVKMVYSPLYLIVPEK